MPEDIDNTPPPENLHKLLMSAMSDLDAYEAPKRVHRIVTRRRVVDLSETIVESWAPMVGLIEEVLSPAQAELRKAELERLDRRAWIFYAADIAAEGPNANLSVAQAAQLAAVVLEHDHYLMSWAWPMLGKKDPGHAATLRDISRGSGRWDDADDVQRLVSLFKDNSDQIPENPFITEAYLDKAALDAAKQLDYLRSRKQNKARKRANAAFAMWFLDYDELMHLGRYLTRREADSLLRFPGVREVLTGGGGGEPEPEPAEGEDEDEDEGEGSLKGEGEGSLQGEGEGSLQGEGPNQDGA
jgi:hypothetical protein